MTARIWHGDDFTALTVAAPNGATLNIERTDDGRVAAWIAPPGDNDGPSVQLGEADVIALVAYLSAGTPGALVSASALTEAKAAAKQWQERYAAVYEALRSLSQAYTVATGKPAPSEVNV